MKKALTLILALALCAAMSMTSFASSTLDKDTPQDDATVSMGVLPTYTVTIPAQVTLTEAVAGSGDYTGSDTVSASNVLLAEGEKLVVKIESDFKLQVNNSGYELGYTVKVGTGAALANEGVVAEFVSDTQATEAQSVTLNFAASDPEYAGDYSDIVTFKLTVE